MNSNSHLKVLLEKMRKENLGELACSNFEFQYSKLLSKEKTSIPSASLRAIQNIDSASKLLKSNTDSKQLKEYFKKTAIIKLNGGLGTSMGLERAKSLIKVKNGLSFLEIICKQVVYLREKRSSNIPLILMNSFRTSSDSLEVINQNSNLLEKQSLPFSFLQNKIPKILTNDFSPALWPKNSELEWCPPGHGDFYVALLESGLLEELLNQGSEYLFVSNSDNLGATLDENILNYFAKNSLPFLMEVTRRTSADKKGGHLAKNLSGDFILREVAQCPEDDLDDFQNIEKHKFFNTNNIWINLLALKKVLEKNKGVLPLPLIQNKKYLDPKNKKSPEVLQLETAIGSGISIFNNSSAIEVSRERFMPVKQTSDLLLIHSDIFELDSNGFLKLNSKRNSPLPKIKLNPKHYKTLLQFEEKFKGRSISLIDCDSLTIERDLSAEYFEDMNEFKGEVVI